jgi:hypothetical protein
MTAKILQDSADEWTSIPWDKFQKILLRLQHRIYKATKKSDYKSVRQLQSLLLGSKCAKYLAVKEASQLTNIKKTSQINSATSTNFIKYLSLVSEINLTKNWKHKRLRRIFIPKTANKTISIYKPTIKDSALQFLISYALDPFYKAYISERFHDKNPKCLSYDIHDSIAKNLSFTTKETKNVILKLNLEKCFNDIHYQKLLSFVTLPGAAKKFITSAFRINALKRQDQKFQVSVHRNRMSLFLYEIILHGIENLYNKNSYPNNQYQKGFRYQDDVIFILKSVNCGEELINKAKYFLQMRGLNPDHLNASLVYADNGFEFLHWYFKLKPKDHRLVSQPSKKNRLEMFQKIKMTMKDVRYKLIDRLQILKIMYSDWIDYHQFCDMSGVNIWSITKWVYKYLKKKTIIPKEEIVKHLNTIFTTSRNKMKIL